MRNERSGSTDARNWAIVSASIGVLLVVLGMVGVVGIVASERVRTITEGALEFDIEVEDEGDDLRAAVLDLRHYHRNLVFGGWTPSAVVDHRDAYDNLLDEIGELEQLGLAGEDVAQPEEVRRLAEAYDAGFRPAIELRDTGSAAFQAASQEGLARIREMDAAAEEIDLLGEDLAADSLDRVESAANAARVVLFAMLAGVVLVGVALGVSTTRILSRLRASYDREQHAARELARALRTKTDFIADASHELRTPLTVIRGNADIGLAASGERVHREVLREISTEATRMSRLVDDLLFLARSDAGAPQLEPEYVPVRWLVRRLGNPAEVLARQHGGCVATDLEGDGFVEVDPTRVQQAVMNLVDNAARHGPPGTCLRLASRVGDGELTIEVADAGPGIPAAELPLIFDRFYQVGRRRTRKKGGSGLGLAIAKSIVEAHGGRIAIDSRPGHGTAVAVRFPLCAVPPPTSGPAPAAVPSSSTAAASASRAR